MARKRERGTVRLVGVARRTRSALMVSTALQAVVVMVLAVPAGAQPAPTARPTGASVVGGSITIGQNAASTNINQSTQRGAINWQSFNVGSQHSVNFQQPNAQAITLNTVTGGDPSQIAGKISANGQVVLVNQSGVTFYKGSQVNTAGLMVTAASTDPAKFMAGGKVVFDQPGKANAKIINNGNITITGAGLASLVAPSVANAGEINATLGHVVLAGAKTATLDLYGDKLVSVNVTGAVTQAPDGGEALVTNTGVVRADGGTVRLTARAVDGVVTNLVTAGGTIQARSVGDKQGRITIDGVGGSITILGSLDATGNAPGTKGGMIRVLATDAVIVKSGAVVNASGAAGGGVVAVGTSLKRAAGGPSVTGAKTAKRVVVEHGATIAADASANGAGGRVTVLSSDFTAMDGLITAKGGAAVGDGGFVEVSGGLLALTGLVDASAPHGGIGTLLLDPSDLYVSDTQPNVATHKISNGELPTVAADKAPNDSTVSWVSPALLEAQNASISLAATDNLFVAATNGTTNTLNIGASNLSLTAGSNLTIDRGFAISAGNVQLTATTGSITFNASAGVTAGLITAPQLAGLAPGALVATTATLAAGTGIGLADAKLQGAGSAMSVLDLSVTTSGGVTQSAAGVISAAVLQSAGGVAGSVNLTGANAVSAVGVAGASGFAVTGGGFTLTSAGALGVNGVLSATGGNVSLRSTGAGSAITVGAQGAINVVAPNLVSLRANTFSVTTGGTVTGGLFEYAADTAGVLLLGTGGNIVDLTGVGTGSVRLGSVAGTVTATGITLASNFDLGVGNGGTARPLDLQATGNVTDGGTNAFLNVTTLTGGAGAVTLTGPGNTIGSVGTFATTAGGFTLTDSTALVVNGALSVTGGDVVLRSIGSAGAITIGAEGAAVTVSAANTASFRADKFTNGGTITGGTFEYATDSIGPLVLGTTVAGGLGNIVDLTGVGTNNIRLGAAAGTVTATGITLLSGFNLGNGLGNVVLPRPLDLQATGDVTDGGTNPFLNVSTLTGTIAGGSLSLTANSTGIETVGSFTVSGAGKSFTLQQPSGLLTVAGPLTAPDVMLGAGSFAISGSISTAANPTGSVSLNANAGTIAGAGVITTNTLTGFAIDTVNLSGANQIANLGSFSAGGFTLNNSTALVVSNTLSASAVSLTASDITITGEVTNNGTGTASLVATTGTISEPGTIITATLSGSAGTAADFSGATAATNQINNLGTFNSGGSLTVRDGLGLTINNNVSAAGAVSLTSAATLTIAAGQTVTGSAVNLNGTGITIAGEVTDGGAGTVSLIATTGAIDESAGTLIAGAVTGSSGTGTDLSGALATTNQIANLGSFTSGGQLTVRDGLSLTVTNAVSATGTVALTSAGSLTVNAGQSVTGAGVDLTATDLAISGLVTDGGAGTVNLTATTGSITEPGTIIAGALTGSSAGAASLTGATVATNQIADLGPFAATAGTITVNDGLTLSVSGLVSAAAGDVVLHSTGGTIAVLGSGGLSATGTVSVRADSFTNVAGVPISGNLFEFAQDTVGALTIGAGGARVDLAGNSALALRLGSAEGVVTATSITFEGDFNAGVGESNTPRALDLRTTGGVDGTGGALLRVSTLTGTASGGSAIFSKTTNDVAAIGGFTASGGFTLVDATNLSVTGVLSAAPISLTAPNITVAGSITTGGSATSSTTLIANVGTIGGVGSITTGTLSGSAVSTAVLPGANQFGNLGPFSGSAISLNDGVALTVGGLVSATGAVTLTSGGLLTVGLGGTVSGTPVILSGTGLAITGQVTSTGLVDLIAGSGAITESGSIIAGTLTGSAGGSAALTGAGNQITNLSVFAASDFSLLDSVAFNVTGNVSASTGDVVLRAAGPGKLVSVLTTGALAAAAGTGTVSVRSDAFSVLGAAKVTGGLFEYAQDTAGVLNVGGAIADLTGIATGAVRLGSARGTITANGLILVSTLDLGVGNGGAARPLDLQSNDSIDGGANAVLHVTTLTGIATTGSISLASTSNSVNALGGLTIGTGFTFADSLNLTIANVLAAAPVSLTAPNLTINGSINTGGSATSSTTLVANAGTIGGIGSIVTGVLTGSAIGSAILTGANQIGTIGPFSGSTINLNAGTALTVGGLVSATGAVSLTSTGLLTVSSGQTVTGSTVGLRGTDLVLNGRVTDGGAGTVNLVATTGSITEGGTLIAGTLSGSAATSASLLGALPATNQIATLGSFTAVGFSLNDGKGVVISGPVNGGTGATILSSGLLSITGTVSAAAIGLTGGSIAISGDVTDGGSGSVNLAATSGVNETGTLIAGTLTGNVAGAVTLTGNTATTNQVTNLGSFTAGSLLLNDGLPLTITNAVSASGAVALTSSGLLTVNSGQTVTGSAISLKASSLALNGNVTDGGAGTTTLVATTGSITETGALIAGTLTGSAVGAASLTGATAAGNKIATLGSFTAASFTLNDGSALTASGPVTGTNGLTISDGGSLTVTGLLAITSGNVVLTSTDPGGVAINGGSIVATGDTISVAAAKLGFAGASSIVADTFEFGPAVAGSTVTLGGSGFSSLGSITVSNLRIGKINGTLLAGGIVIAGFNASNLPLELDATGAVTQTGPLINVAALNGTAGSFALTNIGNTIAQLGGGTLSTTGGGGISIFDNRSLTLAGLVSAGVGTVDISTAAGLNVTQGAAGTVIAGVLTSSSGIGGTESLQGTANQIGTISGLTAGGLTVVDSVPLTLAGLVSVAGTVDISTSGVAGVTQGAAGTLVAGVLTSAAGIAGNAVLQGTANQIGTISGLTAAGLTVVNSKGLALAGLVSAGAAGTVDISTSAGGVTQAAGGTLIAGVLTSTTGIAGNASLQGTANQIGTISGLTATGLAIVDSTALSLAGKVSVGAGTIDITITGGAGVTEGAAGTVIAGVLTSAGGIAGNAILQGTANQIGTISGLTAAGLTVVDSQALALAGNVSAGAGTVDISVLGGFNLTEGAAGTLTAGVLTSTGGIGGNVVLQGTANKIGTIAGLTVGGGGLTVVDDRALTLAGNVSVGPTGTVDITTLGAGGNVTQGVGGTLIAGVLTSAGGISGVESLTGAANQIGTITGLTAAGLTVVDSVALTLAGNVSAGASGTTDISTAGAGSNVTQAAAATLTAGVLTSSGGIAGTAILQGTANAIGTISSFLATGSLVVVDSTAMTVTGTVGASAGNVFVTTGINTLTFAPGGMLLSQVGGTIGVLADGLANLGTVGATGLVIAGAGGVFEYAPATASLAVTLGAAASLTTTTGITAGLLRVGAVTLPGDVSPTVNTSAIAIAGAFDAKGIALELDTTGAVTQSAPMLNVSTLTGTAASYTLANAGNTIGQIGGGTLTASTGTLAVVDAAALTIAGTVKATAGNVFISASNNTLTLAPGAAVISRTLGTIGLQAGGLLNLGTTGASATVSTGGGVFELAPGLSGATLTLGAASGGVSLTNLTGIDASLLRIGAITLPGGGSPTTTAGSIAINGVLDATSVATVELDAQGAVTQTAPLINVATLTGGAGSFILTDAGNTIAQVSTPGASGGLIASTGTLALVDGVSMTIGGTVKASLGNVFLKETAGKALTINGSVMSRAGGTVGLQVDSVINLGTTGATGVVNAGAAGLVELAPTSGIGETLGAASGLSLTNLTGITTGTLRIGAVTVAGGASATTTATSIAIGGTFDAAGAKLDLDATGAVAQTAPVLNVSTLTGTAASYTLTNAGNAIGQIGGGTLTATAGTIAIIDSSGLTIAGVVQATAGNVFLGTATGNAITFAAGGSLLSQAGGTIGIQTGSVINLGTTGATGVVNAGTTGLFELAPSGLATETLGLAAGLSLTNLTNITAGTLRIGAVTLPGGAAPTVTAGSIAVAGTFDAATIGILDLEALGTISQTASAPIINLASLIASTNGATGDINLGSTLNVIAAISPISVAKGDFTFGDTPASGTFSVTAGQTITANNVSMTILGTLADAGIIVGKTGNVSLTTKGATADLIVSAGSIGSNGTTSLTTGRDLSQTGGVINGGTVIEVAGGLLTAASTVSATAVSLTGTAIAIPGLVTDGGAGAITLIATNGTINETGTLIAGTLSGSSTGATTLTGATNTTNQVATLGTFTAAGFTLNDGVSVSVAGSVNGATAATIRDSGAVSIAAGGGVTASAISLTGTSIAIAGVATDGGAGTINLIATGGTINETGTLIAGTLSGSSTGATALTGATATTNQIATLGAFTAAGFTLNDGKSLSVSGVLNGGTAATVTDSAGLTIGGTVTAAAVSLTGASLSITGDVTDGGAGTVSLIATGGTINEPGTLIAGTLTGSSTGATTLTGANQIATVTNFTAAGFTLNDGVSLTVSGAVSGGTAATITDASGLIIGGTVTASAVSLTATNIAITGDVTDGGAGTVSLIATAGTINEPGTLTAGTLSGSSTGATTLTGTNQIATVTNFTAAGFTLNDGESLIVSGVLNGGLAATVTDTAGLTVGGTVAANAVSLTATGITITGDVTDGGAGTVSLIATAGTINETGTLIAGTLSGSSTGATGLTGATTTTNQIATLSTFTAAGFTLRDGASLTVAGVVNGGTSVSITDAAALSIGGTVDATAVSLTATNISISGLLTDGGAGATSLIATAGTIGESGTLVAGTLSGSSTGATTLTGATARTNQVATIGTFTAAGFTLNDGVGLAVSGVLTGGTAATVTDSAAVTIGGTVTASAVSLTAANITIPGEVTDGGAGTVSLIATAGTISESGSLISGALSGSSTGATALVGTNQIATLGSFTAPGFTLNDGASLTVSGVLNGGTAATIADVAAVSVTGGVTASTITLTGTSIAISGVVTDGGAGSVSLSATGGAITDTGTIIAGTLSLAATGAITETGTLTALTLSGTSSGATALTGTNAIGSIASFTASGFTLNDGTSLAVTGPINGGTAATIVDGGLLSIGGGVTASAISLTGTAIAIPGVVTDGGAGTVSLTATGGTIDETGTLIAGLLTGSSTGATSLTGVALGNQVASLGNFKASGFTLDDFENLAVIGAIAAGGSFLLADTGNLTIAVASSIAAGSVGITDSGNLTVSGLVSGDAGVTISDLGVMTVTGSIISASGTVGITDFSTMSVTGLVSGLTVTTITDTGALTIGASGTVAATAVNLTAASITIAGEVVDPGAGTVSLIATAGTISETGTLIAGTLSGSSTAATSLTGATPTTNQIATLGAFTAAGFTLNDGESLTVSGLVNGGGAVTITDNALLTVGGGVSAAAIHLTAANIAIPGVVTDGGAGTVSLIATGGTISETGTLIAGMLSGSSTGATNLSGATATANQIGIVTSFTAGSGFLLNDGSSLSVTGPIAAASSFVLTDTGNLVIGTSASITGTAINVTDNGSATIAGTMTSSGSAAVSTSGALSVPGRLTAASGITIASGGDMQVAGTIASAAGTIGISDTGALSVTGLVSGPAGVGITDNGAMTVVGAITSAGGTIGITDNGGLSILGQVLGQFGVAITETGAMTVAGALTSSVGAIGISDNGGLSIPGLVSGQAGVTIADAGPITIAGNVTSNGGSVGVTNNGPFNITGVVSGQTGVTTTGTGSMTVAGIVTSAGGAVGITNAGGFTATGTVQGQAGVTETVTAGDMNLFGLVTSASGPLSLSDTGVLSVGNAASVISTTSITITDGNTINLGGLLDAPRIVVDNGTGASNFLAGTTILTGGQVRPPGVLTLEQLPSTKNLTQTGFFLTTGSLVQNGTLTVRGIPTLTSPNIVRIDASSGIQFAAAPGGILGTHTWLILGLTDNNIKATGGIVVANLDAAFTGQGDSSALSGSVGGLGGSAAAGASNIAPTTRPTFQINGCPIGSINCVLLTTQGIPAASPLRDFTIGSVFDPTDDDDLLLPLVSDEVY